MAPARIHLASHIRVAKPAKALEPTAIPTHPAATRSAAPHAAPHSAPYATPHAAATATTSPGAAAPADSYPYATSTTDAPDAWGFTQRQCVSYAAWRLSTDGHAITNRDGWGSASNWDDTARRLGRPVSTTPFVGAVAQWDAGETSGVYASGSSTANGRFTAGGYGHVGYVTAVYSDGSVAVAQYNAGGDRTFSSMRMRAPRYL